MYKLLNTEYKQNPSNRPRASKAQMRQADGTSKTIFFFVFGAAEKGHIRQNHEIDLFHHLSIFPCYACEKKKKRVRGQDRKFNYLSSYRT
jgi:hypothetical protein